MTNTFITSEKPGKPMFSVPRIKVISLHSLKSWHPPNQPRDNRFQLVMQLIRS